MPRRMGALQVRGSQDDAEEIYWMLSEGEEPAEWGNVLYNDKTNTQSHRTKFRGWLVTDPVSVSFWAAVRNGWVRYGNACYRINAIGGDRLIEQSTSHKQGAEAYWPPLPKRAAEDTSGLRPGTTFAGRQENERIRGQRQDAERLRQAAQPARDELQAEFKEDLKRSMLELVRDSVKQELSEQAAAPPAAAAAPGDGEAGAQDLKAQLQQLQQTVAELKVSYETVQQQYFKAFAAEKAAEYKIGGLEDIVKAQAGRIRQLESPFVTPEKSPPAAWFPGAPPQQATRPVSGGGAVLGWGSRCP